MSILLAWCDPRAIAHIYEKAITNKCMNSRG